MKNSILFSHILFYNIAVVLMVCSDQLSAQTSTSQDISQYLFPEFSRGRVKMKVGTDVFSNFNYNTVTEKMVFQKNGQLFDMTNLDMVDTIYLQKRIFIPLHELFYEVLVNGPVVFFIQQKSYLRSRGTPAAYGGTSETSSSHYVANINTGGGNYNLKLPTDLIVKYSPVNWVRVNNKMFSFNNTKQFLRIFPEKATQLKQFIVKSKLNIENREDLIKLGIFCNELMR
jgi:hypothetical protein